jgi:pullulanase/glycogen debranching enzyme
MKKRILLLFVFVIGLVGLTQGQVITVSPVFPTQNDTVTVTFDASEGNADLVGVSPVYAHLGVITLNSTSPSDWKFVQGTWGTADAKVLMTDLGNNKHEIKFHIPTFYNLPANETVLQLACVFRSADGSQVGRATDGGDIYYDVYSANSALLTTFITPAEEQFAVNTGENIPISAAISKSATITLLDNGTQIAQATNATMLSHSLTVSGSGSHLVELVTTDGTNTERDTFNYIINGLVNVQDAPANMELGANYLNDTTVLLKFYAPNKQFVYVIGDFNGWNLDPSYYMNRGTDNATWWIEITGLTPNTEYGYQYLVDNALNVADPFAEKVLDPNNDQYIPSVTYPNLKPYPTGKTNGIVSVLHPAKPAYNWQVTNFQKPANEDLIVYELLVRDFIARHDYETLLDTLDYLETLGVNAIEFMPVNEFEGNESWGYNPSYHMALDKYYGTETAFKAFIDECHSRGIAIILDVVYNHVFSQSPLAQLYWDGSKPTADNPWLNVDAKHPFNVGYDVNHESQATKDWVDRVMKHWITEFKVDGFRFDLSKGFTQVNNPNDVGAWGQYDQSRVNLIQRIANVCWAEDNDFYVILEHFADNGEEKVLADAGMMLWGNITHNYNEATMGYISGSNFNWIDYKQRNWANPHVMGYMESHDEERLMFKNLQYGNSSSNYSTKDLNTALDRMGQAAAFFFTIPGPKMMWQFGELGYDISIDDPCRVCNKPILWNYFTDGGRINLYNTYKAIIDLRKNHDVFKTTNYSLDVSGGVKEITLQDPSMNVKVVGNFEVTQQSSTINFPNSGWWYDYISGDSVNISNGSMTMTLAPGEYHIYTTNRLTTGVQLVSNKNFEKENDFYLNAYPNPVQGNSTIAYYLPKSSEVIVQVMDLAGRNMMTLINEYQNEGDQYIKLNSSQLAAGTYFIHLAVNGQMSTQKLVILE